MYLFLNVCIYVYTVVNACVNHGIHVVYICVRIIIFMCACITCLHA